MTILIILLVIAGACAFLYFKGMRFKAVGKTVGTCAEVRVETDIPNGSPYNQQLRGRDSRMYRPYIRYEWEGREYIAKSFASYAQAKIFPGDKVNILVNADNKELVKIIK